MSLREPNFLDKLLGIIPGYAGYADRESRRGQDKRLRDHVAAELDRGKHSLDGLVSLVTQRGEIEGLDEVDTLKRAVGTCADKLRHASYGESGFRDDVSIESDDLGRVYQKDAAIHSLAEDLTASFAALTSDTFRASLPDLRRKVDELKAAIAEREDILREVFH
jgi:hypothetical protein